MQCTMDFGSSSKYKEHRMAHTDKRPSLFQLCGIVLKRRWSLKQMKTCGRKACLMQCTMDFGSSSYTRRIEWHILITVHLCFNYVEYFENKDGA